MNWDADTWSKPELLTVDEIYEDTTKPRTENSASIFLCANEDKSPPNGFESVHVLMHTDQYRHTHSRGHVKVFFFFFPDHASVKMRPLLCSLLHIQC